MVVVDASFDFGFSPLAIFFGHFRLGREDQGHGVLQVSADGFFLAMAFGIDFNRGGDFLPAQHAAAMNFGLDRIAFDLLGLGEGLGEAVLVAWVAAMPANVIFSRDARGMGGRGDVAETANEGV